MDKKDLEAFAIEAAKNIKTEQDLADFSRMLKKVTVERALNAELDDHLGYDRHQSSNISNSRNGYSQKTLSSDEWKVTRNYWACGSLKMREQNSGLTY